jgi:hypothetical protein
MMRMKRWKEITRGKELENTLGGKDERSLDNLFLDLVIVETMNKTE